ncbi:sigma factor [Aerococcus sanguinicola]
MMETREERNALIQEHFGFIIKTVSEITGRYVEVGNDDALSVALMAFDEAISRYDEERGHFLAFCKLVIKSRVLTHLKGEGRGQEEVSLDDLQELGFDPVDERPVSQTDMKVEIEAWKGDLEDFAITLEQLADESPKHRDTRERAIDISEASSKKRAITDHLFTKKRLPIRKMSRTFDVTEKVIKGSKTFIISVIVIFVKEYRALLDWIRG